MVLGARSTDFDQGTEGESLSVSERIVVSPTHGVFWPLENPIVEGMAISAGALLGRVAQTGGTTTVESPFAGVLVGYLVWPGERVRPGQPVAWMRAVPMRKEGAVTAPTDNGRRRCVADLVQAFAEYRPAQLALVGPDGVGLDGATLLDRVRRGAGAVAGAGIARGGVVALDTPSMSWADAAVAFLSCAWLGATTVFVTDVPTTEAAITTLGASLMVTMREGAAMRAVRPADLDRGPATSTAPAARPEDRLDVVFTSGTTGAAKPVASTHASWADAVRPELVASRARRTVAHTGVPIAFLVASTASSSTTSLAESRAFTGTPPSTCCQRAAAASSQSFTSRLTRREHS